VFSAFLCNKNANSNVLIAFLQGKGLENADFGEKFRKANLYAIFFLNALF
jgi:hypothetical protein